MFWEENLSLLRRSTTCSRPWGTCCIMRTVPRARTRPVRTLLASSIALWGCWGGTAYAYSFIVPKTAHWQPFGHRSPIPWKPNPLALWRGGGVGKGLFGWVWLRPFYPFFRSLLPP